VTAGDYSGRDYGHDDQPHPPYQQQVGGYQRFTESSWPAGPGHAGPDHAGPADSAGPADHRDGYGYADRSGYESADRPGYESADRPGYEYTGSETEYLPRTEDYPPGRTGWSSDDTRSWHQPAAVHERGGRHGRRTSRGGSERPGLPLWQELPLLLIIAFCVAILVRTFLLQAFYIPSGSMEETLVAGDRVLVNKVVYRIREPARGEVVVFRGTDAWSPQPEVDGDIGMFARVGRTLGDWIGISRPGEKDYIKRVIGLPGDRLSCCDVDGRIFVNGFPVDEEYVLHNAPLGDGPDSERDCRTRRFDEVVVEPGQMFVMGDHRAVSQDSRCQGQVPIENIIGRAFVIVWPSDRWTGLSEPDVFASVPTPAGAGPLGPVPPDPTPVLPLLLPVLLTVRRCGAFPARQLDVRP
jgi:signal peptidase I